MSVEPSIAQGEPSISVIIAVYNDWQPLERCLEALDQQVRGPAFEVLVVDDGSTQPAPPEIQNWSSSPRFQLIQRLHAGPAAARNQAIRQAAGQVLIFVDADSVPDQDCIANVAASVQQSPDRDYFQLRLAGDRSTLAGRAEDLRLAATQDFLLRPDGKIRFLNTAGFAIRRSAVQAGEGLFDERALRGEDTLLLANLLRRNQLPTFVPSAVVRHSVRMNVVECLWKDSRSAVSEAKAYAIISTQNVKVRVSHAERLQLLRSIWARSKDPSIGRTACLLLIARQSVRFVVLALRGLVPRDSSASRHTVA